MAFMNAMALGATIRVSVGSSIGQLRRLGGAFKSTTRASGMLAQKLGSVGLAMGAVGAAGAMLTTVLAGMGEKAAAFEAQMSAVGAVLLKPRSEISEMEKVARRLGSSTVFTATQVGEGMELMSRSGFDMIDVIGPNGKGGGIEGVLNAAAASGDTLAETANNVSNVLKGMGLETSEATRVADVLALASSRTNSTIGSLGESMKNVASTARQFNIPLEETVAGVALLQDVGLDASVAGSSMNTMLSKMTTLTDKTKVRLGALGVAFEDAHGDMLPFPQVLDAIASAAAESGGNMDAAGLLVDLFGLRGQKAATNLKDMATSGKLSDLVELLKKAKGSAEKMAELRLDNLTGQMTLLSSATEGFAIDAMMPLNVELRAATKNMTDFVQAVTLGMEGKGEGAAAEFGMGLMIGITAVADGTRMFRTEMEAIISSLGEGDVAWAKMAGVITVALIALAVVLTPVALAIAGIAAVGFVLGEALLPVMIAVAGIAQIIGLLIGGMFLAASANGVTFTQLLTDIHGAMVVMWQAAKESFMSNWTAIEQAFAPGLATLKEAWEVVMETLTSGGVETSATFKGVGETMGTLAAMLAILAGWVLRGTALFIKFGVVIWSKFMKPAVAGMGLIAGGFLDLIYGANTLHASLGRIFFGIGLMMSAHMRLAINGILEMFKVLMNNPVTQAIWRLLGVDTAAALTEAQAFISEPPMPEWMKPQDKAATLSGQLLELMGKGSAEVATPHDSNVTVNTENKNQVDITTEVKVDGAVMAIATGRHHQDIADRTGATSTPYQRRQILEHGSALLHN